MTKRMKTAAKDRSGDPNAGLAFYLLGLLGRSLDPARAGENFRKARDGGYEAADVALRLLELDLGEGRWSEASAASMRPLFEKTHREFEYEVMTAVQYDGSAAMGFSFCLQGRIIEAGV
ncbi:MAG: hypothetical protein FJY82_07225 [Candidatus Aminicenantes bacterium]|nr:hypothetical protein [Candidatus Aminicenantes bacterium]